MPNKPKNGMKSGQRSRHTSTKPNTNEAMRKGCGRFFIPCGAYFLCLSSLKPSIPLTVKKTARHTTIIPEMHVVTTIIAGKATNRIKAILIKPIDRTAGRKIFKTHWSLQTAVH